MPKPDLMIILLALAGAGVDAVLIMGFNVLTAAQTGNTILFAVAIARGDFLVGASAAASVAAFVAGTALGQVIISRAGASSGMSPVARALIVEVLLLIVLLVAWRISGSVSSGVMVFVLVVLAAGAMGIQSAAVRRLHSGPTTTYVTGVLTSFTTGIVGNLLDGKRASSEDGAGNPMKFGLVWVIYAGGAVLTGILFLLIGEAALALPIAAVIAVLGMNPSGKPVSGGSGSGHRRR